MLAYAVDRRPEGRANSPSALMLILAGHAAVIAAVMAAKLDLPARIQAPPTIVDLIDPPKPPPPPPPEPADQPNLPTRSTIDQPIPLLPFDPPAQPPLDLGPPVRTVDPVVGPAIVPPPVPPIPAVVRRAARFATPADDVRPPYPEGKRRAQQEASLRLALVIAPSGRVIGVEPVGPADADFLAAARRHILARWRYQPATENGDPIESRIVVTLRFELEE